MKKVAIIGAGGHGREVAEILADSPDFEPAGFIDEDPALQGRTIDGLPVLGDWGWLEANRKKVAVLVAVGTPAVCQKLVERALALKLSFASAISPSARISPLARVGPGVTLFPGVVINTGADIGGYTILNVAVSVSHDSVVGKYCNINPGARLAGNVRVGDGCYIGMGTNIIQGRAVGDWTTVGAGSAVVRDLPAHATAVGVPARVIKRRADVLT